jgi:hypothetical protein
MYSKTLRFTSSRALLGRAGGAGRCGSNLDAERTGAVVRDHHVGHVLVTHTHTPHAVLPQRQAGEAVTIRREAADALQVVRHVHRVGLR